MTDWTGRVCMVTGATNGLGEVTARALAQRGATVVIVGRDAKRTDHTMRHIKATTSNPDVFALTGDLALIQDVRRVVDAFRGRFDRLDVLVNNAGALFLKRQRTVEGLERTFALNHLSYFLITNLLLDLLVESGQPGRAARVVNVSSAVHERAALDFRDLQNTRSYNGLQAYARSKLMNIMFSNALSLRLRQLALPVTVNALHPGAANTGLLRDSAAGLTGALVNGLDVALKPLRSSPQRGAEAHIHLATSPDVEGITGKYFVRKAIQPSSPASMVQRDWERLWDASERIGGLRAGAAVS